MQPIQPAGDNSMYAANVGRLTPSQIAGGQSANDETGSTAAAAGSSCASNTTAISVTTSRTSMINMGSQVQNFLGSLDSTLANNENLKLLIAALIMSVLLNGDDSGSQAGQGALQALESLSGGVGTALYISLESSTNSVQIQQQSYRLDSSDAVQSAWSSGSATQQTGQQIDETA